MIWHSAPLQGRSWPPSPRPPGCVSCPGPSPPGPEPRIWEQGSCCGAGRPRAARESFCSPHPAESHLLTGADATGAEEQTSVPAFLSHRPCGSRPADGERPAHGTVAETVTSVTVSRARAPKLGSRDPHASLGGVFKHPRRTGEEEPMLREVNTPTHGHTANKWQS